MCQHTLQSSPARDGHVSSGMCCGCSVELMLAVQVLRSLRQPASQETVALSPLSRHGVALEWCLKASDVGWDGWAACQTEPDLESVPGVLHMASCFPGQGKARMCGRAIHIEG